MAFAGIRSDKTFTPRESGSAGPENTGKDES
jgi:hypothetical protein